MCIEHDAVRSRSHAAGDGGGDAQEGGKECNCMAEPALLVPVVNKASYVML
jgi:hypothetical protein